MKVCTIIGATGAQGSSIARALAESKRFDEIRLCTRDTSKEAAQKIHQECIGKGSNTTLVKCDLDDVQSLDAALMGATHSFCVTNWWELFNASGGGSGHSGLEMGKKAGEMELAQGKAWVDACKKHNLEFVIFSGLENVSKLTGGKLNNVHHFNFKGQIEEYMWSELPGKAASVRPSLYMENFLTQLRPQPNGVLAIPMGDKKLNMMSVMDLGGVVDGMFAEGPTTWAGKALGAAAELMTCAQIAAAWSVAVGKPVIHLDCTVDEYAKSGFPGDSEMAEMFAFYQDMSLCVRDPLETRRVSTGRLRSWAEFCVAHRHALAF